jgi:RNA polymerase sigma-70 factor, ECF subfamily
VGGNDSDGVDRLGGGASRGERADARLSAQLQELLARHRRGAVVTVTRLVGDFAVAEDAVQEACAAALVQWPSAGIPREPRAWLVGVARHKALDYLRREARRGALEARAASEIAHSAPIDGVSSSEDDDELCLLFMCCHPALEPEARVALTLRAVGGLTTAEIAAAFLVPEPTMAKRLVRAKHKINRAGIPFRLPAPEAFPARLRDVLRVIYLVFSEGHMASTGEALIRGSLCEHGIRLAHELRAMLPAEPEVEGLLALLLLTDARRAARQDHDGTPLTLEEQDRARWDADEIAEGERLIEHALRRGRPGPYQLQAAIAACHSTARSAEQTDWRQIAALYDELMRFEPTPITRANRAIAMAMAEGPAAGLRILDTLADDPQLARWPRLRIARADLLARLGDAGAACAEYQAALDQAPSGPERRFIQGRVTEISRQEPGRK